MTDAAFRAAAKEIAERERQFLDAGMIQAHHVETLEAILRRHLEPKWTRTKPTEPGYRWVSVPEWYEAKPHIRFLDPEKDAEFIEHVLELGGQIADLAMPLPPPADEGERDADHD